MAISIPIISEFQGNGIAKAKQEFKQLEGAGAKAGFALKKALLPATAAVGALAAGLVDATKGAIEDAQAQELLANQIRNNTVATDAQIAANEDWIATQGQLLGITDDELRPALAKLVTQTKDVAKAQEGARIAMDIAAATGKSLDSVTTALAKAYGGNTAALAKLSPELRDMIKDGMSADEAIENLAQTFAGAATTAANTAQGQFKRLNVALNETKESVGAALLPAVEAVLPFLIKFGNWAQANPTAFLAIAAAIGAIATAIIAVNIAMALNPIALIAAGIAALIAVLVVAYKRFDSFREIVDAVFGGIRWWINNVTIPAFNAMFTVFKAIANGIAAAWNNTFGKLSFTVPKWVPGIGGKGFDVPNIPMLAAGGIVTAPTLAMIGEAGPEAVIPLDRMGDMGGGTNVTIHVNGGDPNAVVAALRTYMRQNGSIPIRVSNIF